MGRKGLPGCGGRGLSTLPREPPVEEVRKAAAWCEATHELCGVQTKRLVLRFLVPCGSGSDQKCVLILFLASLFVVSKKKSSLNRKSPCPLSGGLAVAELPGFSCDGCPGGQGEGLHFRVSRT